MITLRSVQLPADRDALLRLDTAFTTAQIVAVDATERAFTLRDVAVDPPISKSFPLAEELDPDPYWQAGIVAENAGEIVGFLALRYEAWNQRVQIWHLYVNREQRGNGIGKLLIAAADDWAKQQGARCLWLEVTNLNYPAIAFYRRVGFVFCGLDTSLYDPIGEAGGETALYFMRGVHSTPAEE